MKRTSVHLDDSQFSRLEVIAQVDGRSISDAVREAVDLFIDERLKNEGFRHKAQQVVAQIQEVVGTAAPN